MPTSRAWSCVAFFATLALPASAAATEHEWHIGASYGYAVIDFPRGDARNGTGGGAHVRYGLTDAFDLAMNATVFGFPDNDRLTVGTNAGINYVVDVSRWIPSIGASVGVVDMIGLAPCDAYPARCGHRFMPAIGLPASLEFRVIPTVPLGVRFEYQFLFLGGPDTQIYVGFYGAFTK